MFFIIVVLSQSRRLPLLQVVSKNKYPSYATNRIAIGFISVAVLLEKLIFLKKERF